MKTEKVLQELNKLILADIQGQVIESYEKKCPLQEESEKNWITYPIKNYRLGKIIQLIENDEIHIKPDIDEVEQKRREEIIKAWNGKGGAECNIQTSFVEHPDKWYDYDKDYKPIWNWQGFNYRVKPEPTYKEKFDAWVSENKIKVGDCVKITRVPTYKDFNDWGYVINWFDEMESCVGRIGEVVEITRTSISLKVEHRGEDRVHSYPFMILEPVPKPQYKPYAKVNPAWVLKKIRSKNTGIYKFISAVNEDDDVVEVGDIFYNLSDLFVKFEWYLDTDTFEPCGELV